MPVKHLTACFVSAAVGCTSPLHEVRTPAGLLAARCPGRAHAVFVKQSAEFNTRPLLSPLVLDRRSRRSRPARVDGIPQRPAGLEDRRGRSGDVQALVSPRIAPRAGGAAREIIPMRVWDAHCAPCGRGGSWCRMSRSRQSAHPRPWRGFPRWPRRRHRRRPRPPTVRLRSGRPHGPQFPSCSPVFSPRCRILLTDQSRGRRPRLARNLRPFDSDSRPFDCIYAEGPEPARRPVSGRQEAKAGVGRAGVVSRIVVDRD